MNDQKNMLLAIVLSGLVLIGWQMLFGLPQIEKKQQQTQEQQQQTPQQQQQPQQPQQQQQTDQQPSQPPAAPLISTSREAAVTASSPIPISTTARDGKPRLSGSISLKGGRIDDLSLLQYRETIDPTSPPIVLLSPVGSPEPYFAQFGWTTASPGEASTNNQARLTPPDAVWRQEGSGPLTETTPVTLVWDNGQGIEIRRIVSVDDRYMFTITDEVSNKGSTTVTLHPTASIERIGAPKVLGYTILHEGLIGAIGSQGTREWTYAKIESNKKPDDFESANSWIGITDKYWAAVLLPDPTAKVHGEFRADVTGLTKIYQGVIYGSDAKTIAPGGMAANTVRLFAGAKEVATLNAYEDQYNINLFNRVIDWGYFIFITKPMFYVIDWIYHFVGNFGIAILIITVCVKILFFPLANKSYASMAKMKSVQPEMTAIRERYADDKAKQQQAMMDLYKRDKINPVAGCLPIAIQIPVFFALYKVLFITIEMRHAPFFGWIHDLAAPDPLPVLTLFGLIPWDPSQIPYIGTFLMIGLWPLIMGVTMWIQMKLNPPPPDPTQQMVFNWMPIIFTFMLSSFPAGLVIYWAWNNTLSVLQQSVIMHRHGAKITLFDNIKGAFVKKKAEG